MKKAIYIPDAYAEKRKTWIENQQGCIELRRDQEVRSASAFEIFFLVFTTILLGVGIILAFTSCNKLEEEEKGITFAEGWEQAEPMGHEDTNALSRMLEER